MRRRDLGDVLHYFISEDEQREARQRRIDGGAPPACWCLPATPERPLSCAVAVDLAVAAERNGLRAEILAPFSQSQVLFPAWRVVDFDDPDSWEGIARELEAASEYGQRFLAVYPQ